MKLKNKRKIISGKFILTIFLSLLFAASSISFAESNTNQDAVKGEVKISKFQDQFSELDDKTTAKVLKEEDVLKSLERSRQFYLQALLLVEDKDTSRSSWYFDRAIASLNELIGVQGIEKNQDFADLAQSIIEDYEANIQSIDKLNEDTPLFIIKDKLFDEMEGFSIIPGGNLGIESLCEELLPPLEAFEIDLPMNSEVERGIKFLTTHRIGQPFFTKALERTTKWFPMLRKIAKEEGLPEEIIYLSMIESGLNPNAVSRAKAVGMWQFMYSTGKMYGLNASKSDYLDERRDPVKATRAAYRHLRDLYNQFGSWHLALAAYNVGSGGVSRRIKRSGKANPTYWDIRTMLPRETAFYVPLYIAAAKITMNPEKYGISLDTLNFHKEYKYDVYTLKEPSNLNSIAEACAVSVDSIKALNPELINGSTPPDWAQYQIKLPYGSLLRFAANYKKINEFERAPWLTHKVDRKESLSSIASKYGVSEDQIIKLNNITKNDRLIAGATIKVPVDLKDYKGNLYMDPALISTPLNNGEVTRHMVRHGESIYTIARRYGVRAIDVRNLNNLSFRGEGINSGQELLIAKKVASKKRAEEILALQEQKIKEDEAKGIFAKKDKYEPTVVKHIVKKGESLGKIAEFYQVSVPQIINENNLPSVDIRYNQVLKITTPLNMATNESVNADNSSASVNKSEAVTAAKPVYHKVRRGETLSEIADRYGVSSNDVRRWNRGKVRGNTIYYGTRLKINSSKSIEKSNLASKSSPKYYKIQRGDTLTSISRKFGVSVATIMENNGNISERRLQVGQRIRIQ